MWHRSQLNDRSRLSVRSDPHVLMVGDPGLGKSQLLQGVSMLAPRGVYVCGNTTSTTGLTVVRTPYAALSHRVSQPEYVLVVVCVWRRRRH